jgi:hypothetical protein
MTGGVSRDQIVASAKGFADLIDRAEAADPALASQLKGKALAASKTVWGTLIALIVGWVVSRYGLDLSADGTAEVTGLIVMGSVALLRWVSTGPITGWIKPATADEVAKQAAVGKGPG